MPHGTRPVFRPFSGLSGLSLLALAQHASAATCVDSDGYRYECAGSNAPIWWIALAIIFPLLLLLALAKRRRQRGYFFRAPANAPPNTLPQHQVPYGGPYSGPNNGPAPPEAAVLNQRNSLDGPYGVPAPAYTPAPEPGKTSTLQYPPPPGPPPAAKLA